MTWTYSVANSAVAYLAAGHTKVESFNLSLSDQRGGLISRQVDVTINGVNDTATIAGTPTGSVTEDSTLTAGNTLSVKDVDTGENHFQTPASLAGTHGAFDFNAATGAWGYTLNNGAGNVQALGANVVVHDTLIVKSFDGTDSRTLDVTITGTNDGPVAVADAAPEPRTRR